MKQKSILQTIDGRFIFAGHSASTNGDVIGNHGGSDYWVVKLNSAGDIVWQKTFGGGSLDKAHAIKQTQEGGYILVGETLSSDGDISINHGNIDYRGVCSFFLVKTFRKFLNFLKVAGW